MSDPMISLGYSAAALVAVLTLVATWFYHIAVYKLSLEGMAFVSFDIHINHNIV